MTTPVSYIRMEQMIAPAATRRPDPTGGVITAAGLLMPFSMPGALAVMTSPPISLDIVNAQVTFNWCHIDMGTASGSGTTTFEFWHNFARPAAVAPFVIPAGVRRFDFQMNYTVAASPNRFGIGPFQTRVTAVGSGARDLTIQFGFA